MDRTSHMEPGIDRDSFDAQVHDALSHFYDFPYLESSSLATRLGLPSRQEGGAALHRILVEAIDRLKPSREVAADSGAWKVYRVLHLRFVRSLSASAVASELSLSTRQAQRIQTVAVASVAALLRDTFRSPTPSPVTGGAQVPTTFIDPSLGDDLALDDELTALLAGDPGDVEPFLTTLRGAVDTVRPIVAARHATLELSDGNDLEGRIAPRHLVRPALVQLLLAALDRATTGRVVVSARATTTVVEVVVSFDRTAEAEPSPESDDGFVRRLRVARTLLGGIEGEVDFSTDPRPSIVARLPLDLAPSVLVVEDNPQVAQLLARYLTGSPYRMLRAANGLEGFEVAMSAQPAAITLDLLMPHSDGWELLQALKVHPATRGIPVIVCSVLRERELALALGAADFLPKPVTQHALLGSLKRHTRLLAGRDAVGES